VAINFEQAERGPRETVVEGVVHGVFPERGFEPTRGAESEVFGLASAQRALEIAHATRILNGRLGER
jgi:hypothetical protein